MVQDVKPGGVFMINCQWSDEELAHHLNADAKNYIADNNIQLYTINAIDTVSYTHLDVYKRQEINRKTKQTII